MENRTTTSVDPRPAPPLAAGTTDRSYVDWPAIFGGAVIALAIGLLASGFGAALGLTAISAEEGEGSGLLAVVIAAVWIAVSMVCAYAAGGYVAGRMRRRVDGAAADEVTVRDGMNGLIVWALGIALGAWLVGSAIGNTASAVGNAAAAAGDVAAEVAGGAVSGAADLVPPQVADDPMGFITGSMLRPTTVAPETAGNAETTADAASVLTNLASTGEISDPDRAYLTQLTMARTGMAEPQAAERVDAAVAAAQAAREKAAQAEEAVRDAAETARISAILTAFLITAISLVAGVAAYIGAVKGGRHRDEGRIFGGFAYRR